MLSGWGIDFKVGQGGGGAVEHWSRDYGSMALCSDWLVYVSRGSRGSIWQKVPLKMGQLRLPRDFGF
jgi:hypothetical protein